MNRQSHRVEHALRTAGALAKHGWLLAPVLLVACSRLEIYTTKSPAASFAGYRTYTLGAPEKTPAGFARTPITGAVWTKVQGDIDRELASKGYTSAPAGAEPDLLVRSGSGSRTRERDEGAGVRDESNWISTNIVADYTLATLVIDVYDAHTRQPVWHGSSYRALDGAGPTAVPEASIAEAVQAILRTFPSAAGAATPAPAP